MLAGRRCSASCHSLGRARRDMFQDSCGGKPFPCLSHAYPDEVSHSLCWTDLMGSLPTLWRMMACGAGQAGGHTMFQQRPLWNFGSAWHVAAAPLAPTHSVLEELQDFCTHLVYNPLLVLSLVSVWALFWDGQWWPYPHHGRSCRAWLFYLCGVGGFD